MDCDSGECIVNDGTNDDSRYNSSCNRSITFTVVRAIVTITVIGLIIWALADALTTKNIEEWLVTWISIVEDHMFYGMFILVAIYIVAGILFVPQAMLSVGVGYAFGQAFPNMLYLSIPMAIIVSLGNYMYSTNRPNLDQYSNKNIFISIFNSYFVGETFVPPLHHAIRIKVSINWCMYWVRCMFITWSILVS
jgi:hypothetical protein